jgi:hypothetical protein
MKGSLRILIGLGIAALIMAVAMPASLAQCPQAREFGAQGNGTLTARIIIDTATAGCPNNGNEFGGFWDVDSPGTNSGGPFFETPTQCPVAQWWLTGGMFLGTNAGIQGFIADPSCIINICPSVTSLMQWVVEDTTEDGTNACVIAYQVNETPAAVRWYDHGRTAGNVPNTTTTHIMETFPTVDVTASSGPPPNTDTTQTYRDVVVNFHGEAATTLPASAGIASYEVMYFHGAADPGRLRADWTPLKTVPYADAAIIGDVVTVPCPTQVDDTFLAVGLNYAGGVSSMLVGKSTAIECNPTLADPNEPAKRPTIAPHRRPLSRGR